MQTITLAEVKATALKAFKEGRLLAQAPFETYGYSIKNKDGINRVCAIGATLNSKTLAVITKHGIHQDTIESEPESLRRHAFNWDESEQAELIEIQGSHDRWLNRQSRTDLGHHFVDLIGG